MMVWWRTRSVVALIAGLISSEVAAGTLYERPVLGWTLGAYTDNSGKFKHCAASAGYKSGIYLLFSINRSFNWSMGFANPSWRLAPGSTYPVQYNIDSGPSFSANAVAVNDSVAEVQLINSEVLFAYFQKGQVLTVRAAGETFQFNLTNSSKVLSATLECTRLEASRGSSNPFVERQSPRPPSSGSSEASDVSALRAEAATLAANILSEAKVDGFRMASSIPKELDIFHSLWLAPGLIGGVIVDPESDVGSATTLVLATDAAACKGRFATAKLPVSANGAAHLKAVCEIDGKNKISSYVFLPRSKGGVYVLATFGGSEETIATGSRSANPEDIGGKLMDAGIKVSR